MDITFVVPIYNAEKYLAECLDSLIKQNVDKEILCINDGSTDNSLNILQEYAEKYAEIRIIDKENEGVSKARNLGIDEAKGRYIWFVDADDYLLVPDLAELIYSADKHQVDLIRGMIALQGKEGNIRVTLPVLEEVFEKYKQRQKYAEITSNTQYLLKSIQRGFIPKITAGFYRTSFLRENQCYFPNSHINNAEDEYFEVAVFSKSLDVKLFEISMAVYFYRYNEASSTKSRLKQFEGSLIAYNLILEHYSYIEEKLASLLEKDNPAYFGVRQLLWAVRFIALRLNCAACCDIYLELSEKEQEDVSYLVNAENIRNLEEFKYMILAQESGQYYLSLFNGLSKDITTLKKQLNK